MDEESISLAELQKRRYEQLELRIEIGDLIPETREEVIAFYGMKDATEVAQLGPIAILTKEE